MTLAATVDLPVAGIALPAWLAAFARPAFPAMPDVSTQDDADDSADLVAATLGGDDRAYAEIIRRHKDRILRLAARFARNPADLDEIAQDVFVKAHRSLARYRADAPLEHWLARIATRCCQDYLRRIYRRRWFTSLDFLREEGVEPVPEADNTDPRVELLRVALRRLKPEQHTLLVLLELENRGVRETSILTGLSESNVKVRAHRARAALRAQIERLETAEKRQSA